MSAAALLQTPQKNHCHMGASRFSAGEYIYVYKYWHTTVNCNIYRPPPKKPGMMIPVKIPINGMVSAMVSFGGAKWISQPSTLWVRTIRRKRTRAKSAWRSARPLCQLLHILRLPCGQAKTGPWLRALRGGKGGKDLRGGKSFMGKGE